jgi:hypothetical protein
MTFAWAKLDQRVSRAFEHATHLGKRALRLGEVLERTSAPGNGRPQAGGGGGQIG